MTCGESAVQAVILTIDHGKNDTRCTASRSAADVMTRRRRSRNNLDQAWATGRFRATYLPHRAAAQGRTRVLTSSSPLPKAGFDSACMPRLTGIDVGSRPSRRRAASSQNPRKPSPTTVIDASGMRTGWRGGSPAQLADDPATRPSRRRGAPHEQDQYPIRTMPLFCPLSRPSRSHCTVASKSILRFFSHIALWDEQARSSMTLLSLPRSS